MKVSSLRYWLINLSEASSRTPEDHSSSGFEFASVSFTQESQALILEIQGVKLSIINDYDEILYGALKTRKTSNSFSST